MEANKQRFNCTDATDRNLFHVIKRIQCRLHSFGGRESLKVWQLCDVTQWLQYHCYLLVNLLTKDWRGICRKDTVGIFGPRIVSKAIIYFPKICYKGCHYLLHACHTGITQHHHHPKSEVRFCHHWFLYQHAGRNLLVMVVLFCPVISNIPVCITM